MSRISSSSASGIRAAVQPLSNIYTILLVIGFLVLVPALVMLWVTLEQRYGVVWAVTEPGKNNLNAPADAAAKQKDARDELDNVQAGISAWKLSSPVKPAPAPAAPAAEGATAPVAAPAPEGAATPAAPAAEGGAAPAAEPAAEN
jgi:hypothetical protein